MKKFGNLSIKVKVPILIGLASLAVFVSICLLLSIPLRSIALKDSTTIARLSAMETCDRLTELINGSANVIRGFSGIITELSVTKLVDNDKKRELLLMELENMYKNRGREKVHNFWVRFEPNAFDGLDEQFINRVGSNEKGIFAPWFTEELSLVSPGNQPGDFYNTPKETLRETVTDLYWDNVNGTDLQMFSISIPIYNGDIFIGVIGTDIYVNYMIEIVEELSAIGAGKIVSDKGIIMVHYNHERLGQLTEYGNRAIIDRLPEGKILEGIYKYEGRQEYKIYVPIHLGEGNSPWFYAVDVPLADIYANSRQTVYYLIVFCIVGIMSLVLVGWFLMQPMLKDIINVTGLIRNLSLGHIDLMNIEEEQNEDEIGKMKTELRRLIDGLQHTADFAQAVGKGNLTAEYRLLSDNDVLGNALLEMQRNLHDSDKLKSSFLANMSHEIRTPLNGIVGLFSILCEDPKLSDDLKEFASIINNNCKQLLNLINDVLDASKLEAGQMLIRTEQFNLDEMLNDMHVTFKNNLQNLGKPQVYLEKVVDESIENSIIIADPVRLRQIINNLLGNAIKFTDKGYIRFGYQLMETNVLEFFVEDTGIGIPENQLDIIFHRFRQTEQGNDRRYGGSGLGLTISRSLAQLMGSDISVTSTEGIGSRFSFTIVYNPVI